MRLIRSTKFAAQIAAAEAPWGVFLQLPLDPFGAGYYRAIQGDSHQDQTFALEHDGRIVAKIECDVTQGGLGRFGTPIEPRIDPALPYPLRRKAAVEIVSELKRLSKEGAGLPARVRRTAALDPDGLLLGLIVAERATQETELRAEIDLALDEAVLFDDLRKGHRQQVRWGEANLTFSAVDQANPDRAAFETFRAFHAEVSGRVTRGAESWDAMFAAIAAGRGDLLFGHLDGLLVSGTLILDGGETAYYASGVYHRAHFDKPLGHASLFRATRRARTRGRAYFDLGELPLAEAPDKEKSIGFFKRGFTNRTVESLILTLPSCA
jgi:hypothetical protein